MNARRLPAYGWFLEFIFVNIRFQDILILWCDNDISMYYNYVISESVPHGNGQKIFLHNKID